MTTCHRATISVAVFLSAAITAIFAWATVAGATFALAPNLADNVTTPVGAIFLLLSNNTTSNSISGANSNTGTLDPLFTLRVFDTTNGRITENNHSPDLAAGFVTPAGLGQDGDRAVLSHNGETRLDVRSIRAFKPLRLGIKAADGPPLHVDVELCGADGTPLYTLEVKDAGQGWTTVELPAAPAAMAFLRVRSDGGEFLLDNIVYSARAD